MNFTGHFSSVGVEPFHALQIQPDSFARRGNSRLRGKEPAETSRFAPAKDIIVVVLALTERLLG